MNNEVLLIPDKRDEERDALAEAWERFGGRVVRIGKFWEKPQLSEGRIAIYGPDTFSLVLAEVIGVELTSPYDEIIASLDMK